MVLGEWGGYILTDLSWAGTMVNTLKPRVPVERKLFHPQVPHVGRSELPDTHKFTRTTQTFTHAHTCIRARHMFIICNNKSNCPQHVQEQSDEMWTRVSRRCRRMNRVGFEWEIVRSLRKTQPQRKHLYVDLGSKATAVVILPKSYSNKGFLGEMQGRWVCAVFSSVRVVGAHRSGPVPPLLKVLAST